MLLALFDTLYWECSTVSTREAVCNNDIQSHEWQISKNLLNLPLLTFNDKANIKAIKKIHQSIAVDAYFAIKRHILVIDFYVSTIKLYISYLKPKGKQVKNNKLTVQ